MGRWSRSPGRGPSGPAKCSASQDLPIAVRRAVQTALTPPTGPVFLSLPMDVQMEVGGGARSCRRSGCRTRRVASAASRRFERAAEVLVAAKNPAILAGSRVTERDAMQELVDVAEQLGAPVITESGTTHGRLAFPADHPLNAGGLPLWSPEVRERLQEYDVLLVVGMDLLRQYIYSEPCAADSRAHQAGADRRGPLADRQELRGGSRRDRRHEGRARWSWMPNSSGSIRPTPSCGPRATSASIAHRRARRGRARSFASEDRFAAAASARSRRWA